MACTTFAGVGASSTFSLAALETSKKSTLPAPAAACSNGLPFVAQRQRRICACLRRQRQLEELRRPGGFSGAKVKRRQGVQVSAEAVGTVDKIREVGNETFHALLEEAGDKLVVLDMYTQWCGPCKLMYPKLVEAADKYNQAVFIKLDCNQENKPLAKSLGIKAVPTFKLFKKKEQIDEIQGAKYDALIEAIEKHI
ncbi:hypothetical protein KFL_003690040 [Klebsormidium nitens]|uniref:Thioredoxin domain-containing protein n=1 Tax=Klebsormidium nitens TaxID=105231 RepID=A0A1Y1IAS9_KLENI|nr:hypothetical protein KFL_003690040 [Klebsormidium nitens]|eukprot:GAQ87673.1 hypothetical protein KFL_003690040 [Klebsormidium nitens]